MHEKLKWFNAQAPIENHFSTNDTAVKLVRDMNTVVKGPWCITKGHMIELALQVTTTKGASRMSLVVNNMDVAKSGSLGVTSGDSASMSLFYKGELKQDSTLAVKVFTGVEKNEIEALNMQLSYKLYGNDMGLKSELPACAHPPSPIDD